LIVYRIAHPDYANQLNGYGAWLKGGRWNNQGEWMLYTAQHASLAILELLAHIRGIKAQIPYIITRINLHDSPSISLENFSHPIPSNWSESVNGFRLTRKIGSDWLRNKTSAILEVPSIHSPFEKNYLINPHHEGLKIQLEDKSWYLHDFRLFPGQ